MSIFADIRTIADHQVLAFTESSDEEIVLRIMFRINGGTSVSMNMGYDDEAVMWKAFQGFCAGEFDEKLAKQIGELERDFIAVADGKEVTP